MFLTAYKLLITHSRLLQDTVHKGGATWTINHPHEAEESTWARPVTIPHTGAMVVHSRECRRLLLPGVYSCGIKGTGSPQGLGWPAMPAVLCDYRVFI